MENMKGYYARDCGPASHNQAMIADENDDKGRTVAVVYDREKARQIVKACNEYEEMRAACVDMIAAWDHPTRESVRMRGEAIERMRKALDV